MNLRNPICFLVSLIAVTVVIDLVMAGDTIALGTEFTYQGQIKQDGIPITGLVDLEFSLHESPVTEFQMGSTHRANAVQVVNGLFDVQVDFGEEVFNGSALWLEVRVRTPHDATDTAPFIALDSRHPVTAAPYALRSLATEEVSWDGITEIPTGFADDVDNDVLGELMCADGQVPQSNGVDWVCADPAVGTGDGHSLDAADGDPIDVVFVSNFGSVGLGTTTPRAKLSIRSDQSLIQGPVTHSDDIVVESAVAVLGLYSSDSGTTGSAISFKEVNPQGPLNDHWAMYRDTNSAGASLRFSYGIDKDYAANPTVVRFTSESGNNAVILSAEAIGSDEILNEPGIARDVGASIQNYDETFIAIPLATRTITVPSSGFLMITANVELNNDDLFSNLDVRLLLDEGVSTIGLTVSTAPPGRSSHFSWTSVITVTPGSHTIDFSGVLSSGPPVDFIDPSLTLVYFPTAYGTVETGD